MRAKILKQHIFFTLAEICLPRTRWLKVVGNSRKSSGRASNYLLISARQPIRAWWPENGGKQHQYADFTRARDRPGLGLDVSHRHPPDLNRAAAVERLSAPPVGTRRRSGPRLRWLPGPIPSYPVRHL